MDRNTLFMGCEISITILVVLKAICGINKTSVTIVTSCFCQNGKTNPQLHMEHLGAPKNKYSLVKEQKV